MIVGALIVALVPASWSITTILVIVVLRGAHFNIWAVALTCKTFIFIKLLK
jgi:hypothetical protein